MLSPATPSVRRRSSRRIVWDWPGADRRCRQYRLRIPMGRNLRMAVPFRNLFVGDPGEIQPLPQQSGTGNRVPGWPGHHRRVLCRGVVVGVPMVEQTTVRTS